MSHDLDESVPTEVKDWCRVELNAVPVEVLHRSDQMSAVLGLRLDDGREVAVKTRPDEPPGRAAACVEAQRQVADAGLPVAPPVTGVLRCASPDDDHPLARHAEEWRAGGTMMRETDRVAARRCAVVLADLMAALETVVLPGPVVRPPWVDWDHDGPDVFRPIAFLDERDQARIAPPIMAAGRATKDLLRSARLPVVVGHADFEAQNLRWDGDRIHAIHDFDSVGTGAEAAFVGAAAGAFASQEVPTLAALDSSEAFLEAYQDARRRRFTTTELRVAWAASLWPAIWNARAEALFDHPPVATAPLLAQLDERLARAGL